MNIKNEIIPEIGDYVKYLDNQKRIKIKRIGDIRKYPDKSIKPHNQGLVLMVNNIKKATDYSYNIWPHEVIEILTKDTHPEMFL